MTRFWHFSKAEKKKFQKISLYFLGFFFQIIDFLWPKKTNCIVFGSLQGHSMVSCPKYLYEHIKKNYPDYNVFFYLPFQHTDFWSQVRYMISFAPSFFRAKILISSHPPYDFVPFFWSKRKCVINTWHGIPMKCVYFAGPGETEFDLNVVTLTNSRTSFFPVASSMEAALITRCFFLDPRKIVCIGHPRNDHLVRRSPTAILKKTIPTLPKYSILILYCPTYRKNGSTRFFPFDDFNNSHLNQFLEDHQMVILIRSHVQDERAQSSIQSNRVVEIGQKLLPEINDILAEVDILITDYSGIYFDFLLCNRPCIFIPYDKAEYTRDVGLLFDNYDYWTAGRKVFTYHEFIGAIEEILSGQDLFKAKREKMRETFHFHQTANSSDRLLQLLNDTYDGDKK